MTNAEGRRRPGLTSWKLAASAIAILSFAGCGGGDNGPANPPVAVVPPPAPAPAPVPSPTPQPTSASWDPHRYNVLMIMVDDLRPELGVYGGEAITPNMDRLAREGLLFENAFVSQAVCGPSRAALALGLRPSTSGIVELSQKVDQYQPDRPTLHDAFKRAGYYTWGAGKILHHVKDDVDGFDYRGDTANPFIGTLFEQAAYRWTGPEKLQDELTTDLALSSMPQLSAIGRPFFMTVGFRLPHLPFIAPEEYWDRYDSATLRNPINPDGREGAPAWSMIQDEIWAYRDLATTKPGILPSKALHLRHGYMASVSFVDDQVGRLLDGLEKYNLGEKTIVVLWGDHGYKLGDHGKWAKHSNADIDIRVPLIFRVPHLSTSGSSVDGIVETIDIFPTLMEMTTASGPTDLDGLSFLELLKLPSRKWKSTAFSQYHRTTEVWGGPGTLKGETLRTKDYLYTAWVRRDGAVQAEELYPLGIADEPYKNRANDRRYAAPLKRMREMRAAGPSAVRTDLLSTLH